MTFVGPDFHFGRKVVNDRAIEAMLQGLVIFCKQFPEGHSGVYEQWAGGTVFRSRTCAGASGHGVASVDIRRRVSAGARAKAGLGGAGRAMRQSEHGAKTHRDAY